MMVAKTMGQRSKCVRDGVGAVIVSFDNRVVATGYNGPPAGLPAISNDCRNWCPRSKMGPLSTNPQYDDCVSLHAEANALMVCDRRDREGGSIFVSSGVCFNCAKLIANSGLKFVYVWDEVSETRHAYRNCKRSYDFMRSCGLHVEVM